MNASSIIINCSARAEGNTKKLITNTLDTLDENVRKCIAVVDLCALNITPYDYQGRNLGDDFIPLIERCCACEIIILATPIYWYTVSAHGKIFLDRLTDLLSARQDLKRALEGKKFGVMANFATQNKDRINMIQNHIQELFLHISAYFEFLYLGSYFNHSACTDIETSGVQKLFLHEE